MGKSSVIEALRARGFTAIDTDYDDWSEWAIFDGQTEWMWCETKMRALLAAPLNAPLFVCGCCANQGQFSHFFDHKILFSAPLEIILERVARRSSNPYGKSAAERDAIRHNFAHIQPLLQRSADMEIDTTTMSVPEIVDFLLELALN